MEPFDFDNAAGFQQAVLKAVDAALARGTRSLLCVDRDFAGWPLDDPTLLDALSGWLRRPGRRLILLADQAQRRYRLRLGGSELGPDGGPQHRERCLRALAVFGHPSAEPG